MIRVIPDRLQGIRVPKFYGFAWRRYDMRATVLLPIPLNLLAGVLRRWYGRLVCGFRDAELDEAYAAGQDDGYEVGKLIERKRLARLFGLQLDKYGRPTEQKEKQ